MRERKDVFWVIVISAALLTAGLVLSCGDDDNGGAVVDCQDACENLAECDWIPFDYSFGETVKDCVDACEEEVAGDVGNDFAEMYECISDNTDCGEIWNDCICQIYCEKVDDCGISYWYTVDDCVDYCYNYYYSYFYPFLCNFGFSSCNLIWDYCEPMY